MSTNNIDLDKNMIAGLSKGLRILESFNGAYTRMTQSEVARRIGITPAAARRSLMTLCALGYAKTDGKRYWLDHGVLRLTYAYASSTRMPRLLQPQLDALSARARESASVVVLHRSEVLVAARSTAQRSLTVGLGVGSRLPLHCSATGRVLLASLPDAQVQALLNACPREKMTAFTVTDLEKLRQLVRECRSCGYAMSNEEIELGVRSLAVPLYDSRNTTLAALSISTRADRLTSKEMITQLLPVLLQTQTWARSKLG